MSRILLVYRHSSRKGAMRLAVDRHLHALDDGGDDVVYANAHDPPPKAVRRRAFDAVVLHTTFLGLRWTKRFEEHRELWAWIGSLGCPKVALPQDEYAFAHVLDDWLVELEVDQVLSNFGEEAWPTLYPRLSRRAGFSTALTGYIDDDSAAYCTARSRPPAERPLDVVYRAGGTRYWLGSHGLLKPRIGAAVAERAGAHGLDVDVSTEPEDTILGTAWLDFLLSGRATVGAEGGSSALDPRGELRARVQKLVKADPSLTFEQVDAAMPAGWDEYAFFALGPRHLEAVISRTAQVLVEGTYSGVLEPERHFVPVRRDLSDLDDALERLRDLDYLEELTSRAYEEVYVHGRWTTRDLAGQIRKALGAPRRRGGARRVRSSLAPVLDGADSALGVLRRAAAGGSRRRRSREVEEYWTGHTVRSESFPTAKDSEAYLEWRFDQYPLFRELSGLWGDHRGECVLDYGCGPGSDVVGLLLHSGAARVIGMDVSSTSIRLAGERVALHGLEERAELVQVAERARRLPLADSSVDHVNCQGVLHHTTRPVHLLRELRRVLKPGGGGVVMVYNRDSIWFHVYTAYIRTIVDGAFPGMSIDEAFQANTDGPACPISRAYRPEEFVELCRAGGFDASFAGGYFHRDEPDWLDRHAADALASSRLGDEHKEFIRELSRDPDGRPLYRGKHCGIGGVYHLRPV